VLTREALSLLAKPVISYGKAAIVGVSGDIEHGAAILHPPIGKPMRCHRQQPPSSFECQNQIGQCRDRCPLGHKDDVWSFDQIDTITVMWQTLVRW
jgi:hypothetical protein